MALNQKIIKTKNFQEYLEKRLCKKEVEQIKKQASQETEKLKNIQRCKSMHE